MLKPLFVSLIFMAIAKPLSAGTPATIGKVIIAKKKVEAHRNEQQIKLQRKSPLQQKDVMVTGEKARSQFRLDDGTIFTLGENSELLIDKYLYTEAEEPSASFELVKGVFRAVTGKITQTTKPNFKVKTPLGVIGIRGTDFWGGFLDEDKIDVLFIDGEHPITITNQHGTVELTEPGTGITIEKGKAPTNPKKWPQKKVDRAVATIAIED